MKKILLKIIVCVLLFSCSDEIPDNCNKINTVEIKYDIQDNVIFLDNVWKQNIDIYTLIPINWIGIDAVNYENYIKIVSTKKIKNVGLINFNYDYSINYGNGFEVLIYSNGLSDYKYNFDVLKLNVTHKQN